MVLTEEQKKELLLKYLNPETDFVKANNGKILVSVEASQRIAQAFNLSIAPNAQFEPLAVANYIIKREQQRLAAAASIAKAKEAREKALEEKTNKVVACIKELCEKNKNDFEIAQSLQTMCSDLELSDIRRGIAKATQDGTLPAHNRVDDNLKLLQNRKAQTNKFIEFNNKIKDQNELASILTERMLDLYTKGVLSLGHLCIALTDAGIEEETIVMALNGFYHRYEQVFLEKYGQSNLTVEALTNDIYVKYLANDIFDASMLLGYLKNLNKDGFSLDDFAYNLYRKEGDEKEVYRIMTKPSMSVDERVQELKDLRLQYPPSCLKRTFDILRGAIELPFDEILEKYMGNEKDLEAEEELVDVDAPVVALSEDGESFVGEPSVEPTIETEDEVLAEPESTELAVYQPRHLMVVKKEKETQEVEKKKTLATLLIGAGFVPVVVLSYIFKVDPLVAAENCVTALNQFIKGDKSLKEYLPNKKQLTALLAGMGTTFVGFVKYLKNIGKRKNTEEEVEDEEELDTSVKKGRR